MKIVVLDGYTLNPGDLSWNGVEALGEVTVYDRTPADLILERASGAEILFTNKTPLRADTLDALEGLKYIGVLATGYNVVDTAHAASLGITVTNIPTYGTQSVAQMVFALLFAMTNRVAEHSIAVKEGRWSSCPDFCFWDYPLIELAGKTLGLIGFGRIGQQVGKIADALGMKVVVYDVNRSSAGYATEWLSLDEVFAVSDVISIHCPLFPSTQGMINQTTLSQMKPTALLINTSRGPIINEPDLVDALERGVIAGAAIDVCEVEPLKPDSILYRAKNLIITPHISWATYEARARLMDIAVANLKAFLDGNPVNVVK